MNKTFIYVISNTCLSFFSRQNSCYKKAHIIFFFNLFLFLNFFYYTLWQASLAPLLAGLKL